MSDADSRGPEPDRGFVFAVSGAGYAPLAVEAARSLRAAMPDARIDLFTDTPPADATVFDRVHDLGRSWFRPKFEALRRSRFDRTIYLDADIRVIADLSDVFDLLDRFDIAGVQNQHRNSDWALSTWRRPIPAAFPQINGGLLAIRRNAGTQKLIDDVEGALLADPDLKRDQTPLRELLYLSDLRLAVLPPEYNLMQIRLVETQTRKDAAPRMLHMPQLHAHLARGGRPRAHPAHVIGPRLWRHILRMRAGDRTLGGSVDRGFKPYADTGLLGPPRKWARKLSAWLVNRLG